MAQHKLLSALLALVLIFTWLAGFGQTAPTSSAQSSVSYAIDWMEGSHLEVVEWWNAQARAQCDYAANPWPQAELADERSYVLAARQVLRNEWDISTWIANNRASSSMARIHGAETNCYNGHLDYPPHVHIFYLSIDSSGGWHHINSHQYPDATGKIYDEFVIPNLCGQNTSYHPPINAWVDILDETCGAAWQQRYTTAGDIELRRSTTAASYVLRGRGNNGDLSGADVLLNGSVIYSIDVTHYDPVGEDMVATIKDFPHNTLTTEHWWGNPSTGQNLVGHTTQTAPLNGTPTPTAAATSAPTRTSTPVPGATPAPTGTPGSGSTVTFSVNAFADDGFQDGTTWAYDQNTLWVGDNANPAASDAAARFTGVSLPKGASIQSASLQLYSVAADSTPLNVNIYGDAAGSSAPFSASSLPANRALTAAFTNYGNPAAWAANTWYSVDVTAAVQEIVNRGDWAAGNALSLILKGISGQAGMRRGAKGLSSWNNTNPPKLVVTYGQSAPPPPSPTNTSTPTNTPVPASTPTFTPTPTNTPIPASTPTFTATPTNTPVPASTPTFTPTPTNTAVPPTATFTPTPTSTPGSANTVTFSVGAYPDDGFQDGTGWNADQNTMWVGDNRNPAASDAAVRFTGVALPKAGAIQSAVLQLYSIAADSTPLNVNVFAEASGNSAPFSASSLPSNRQVTAAFTSYNNPPPWAANTWYSIDVTAAVQEVVNRGDWGMGNALSLILEGVSGQSGMRRGAKGLSSWNNTNPPRLVVTYR